MNDKRDSLIHNLDESIAIFAQMRTPDAACVAAFDTLKQARALIAKAMEREKQARAERLPAVAPELVAG